MRHPGIGVRFPLLSSVFRGAAWSGVLSVAVLASIRGASGLDVRTERMIGPGVKCIMLHRDTGPNVIRIIEADGNSVYVRPGATFASDRGLRAAAVSVQAQQATRPERYPIAGVNGDFFVKSPGPYEADPIGALVAGGELISTPYPRSAFLIGPDGRYAIQRLRLAAWAERPDGTRRDLRGINQPRSTDDLILYTPRFGLSTHTNPQGTEAALTGVELPLHLGRTYGARVAGVGERGDSPIPADGVVLSGHGASRDFLRGMKEGDTIQLRLDFDPPVAADTDVVGGGPTLLREGRVVVLEDPEGFQPDVLTGRAPRTAVGFNGRRLLLVTVDGRQPGVSIGMTLVEMAELMRELGCTEAMNLDGGGSTTAWVRSTVINHPSDGQERRVADALFLFSTAPKGPPVRLIVAPEEIAILAGASCPLTVTGGEDEFYNPVPAPAGALTWLVEPNFGVVDGSGRLTAQPEKSERQSKLGRGGALAFASSVAFGSQSTPREGVVRAQVGTITGTARVRVYGRPPRLEVTPAEAVLAPGAAQSFFVRAMDESGLPLRMDGVPVRWSCPLELGQIDSNGAFRAASLRTRGELTAEVAGTRVSVPVVIGVETRLLDGFETAGRWTGTTHPAGVKGSVTTSGTSAHEGRQALRLEYDFSTENGTRAVYANGSVPLGRPLALRLWVRGDGGGAWLRARLRDGRGQAQVIDFSRHLGRLDDWSELTATLPAALQGPLTLEALYLVEPDPQARPRGSIELDALSADDAPLGMPVGTR